MKLKKLLTLLAHAWLLLTPQRAVLQAAAQNAFPRVNAPKEAIIENIGANSNYYLDEHTFNNVVDLHNHVLDHQHEISLYNARKIEELYYWHLHTYYNLDVTELPLLRKTYNNIYDLLKKKYRFPQIEITGQTIKQKFLDSWDPQIHTHPSPPGSYVRLIESIKTGVSIDANAFIELINDAGYSPFQTNYQYILDALVMIPQYYKLGKLSAEIYFFISYAKTIIKQETDYLSDGNDPIKYNYPITHDEIKHVTEKYLIPVDELMSMVSLTEEEAFKNQLMYYIASKTAHEFVATFFSQNSSLTDKFNQMSDYILEHHQLPELIQPIHRACAQALEEINRYEHFTYRKIKAEYLPKRPNDTIQLQIYIRQQDIISSIFAANYTAEVADYEFYKHLDTYTKVYADADNLSLQEAIISRFHRIYKYNFKASEQVLFKLQELIRKANPTVLNSGPVIDALQETYDIHLAIYMALKIKLCESIQTRAQNKLVEFSNKKHPYFDLFDKFTFHFYANQQEHNSNQIPPVFIELSRNIKNEKENINLEAFKYCIELVKKSTLQIRYIQLAQVVMRNIYVHRQTRHMPPELEFLVDYAQLLIHHETDYYNGKPSAPRKLTDSEFNLAVKKNNISIEELRTMLKFDRPDDINVQYINYIANAYADTLINSNPHKNIEELLSELDQAHTSLDPIDHRIDLRLREIIQAKKIKFSTIEQFNNTDLYLIAACLLTICGLIGLYIYCSSKPKPTQSRIMHLYTLKRKFKPHLIETIDTESVSQTPAPDEFYRKWEDFSYELDLVKITGLPIDEYKTYILEKEKISFTTKQLENQFIDFIIKNSDFFAPHPESSVFLGKLSKKYDNSKLWQHVIEKVKNKAIYLENQKKLDELNLKLKSIKDLSGKNISKAKKLIDAYLPIQQDGVLIPENKTTINDIRIHFKAEFEDQDIKKTILDKLDVIYQQLNTNPSTWSPNDWLAAVAAQPKVDDDNAMIPNSLYTLSPIDKPITEQPLPTVNPLPIQKPISQKVELIHNDVYLSFADKLGKHLDMAFNDHIALTNRAYKMLIIQFHSLIVKDNQLFTQIRNRFCHQWDAIGNSRDLQVILYHILRLMHNTRHDTLDSIKKLNTELALYEEKTTRVIGNAKPIYSNLNETKIKIQKLLDEYDETIKSSHDKSLVDLARLAINDILFEIGEVLGHSDLRCQYPQWVALRNAGYHAIAPQALLDQVMITDILVLKEQMTSNINYVNLK